jgi:hypothetical protein
VDSGDSGDSGDRDIDRSDQGTTGVAASNGDGRRTSDTTTVTNPDGSTEVVQPPTGEVGGSHAATDDGQR